MFYKSKDHRSRFVETMMQLDKVDPSGKIDPEYGAAIYIVAADLELWSKAFGYISRRGIDFPVLLEEVDFSGGYAVLVKLAGNLFNSETHIDPVEFMRLDEPNFSVALTAIQIRRYAPRLQDG